jgi:DNA topoisomerase-1
MKLIIVESPAKAVKIQEYLGKNYIVLASKGHICDLAKGGKFGFGIDINNNFKPKYVLQADKVETLDALMKAAKKCDEIILCTDADLEGEKISWDLQERLADLNIPIKRAIFNEIKKSKIQKALKELRDVDEKLVHSQQTRRILDRLVGFMSSPFLMNFFGPKLSSGRVQSVVTRMIVDREREIETFIPEEFWTLQANLSKDDQDSFVAKYSGRPTNEVDAKVIYNKLSAKNADYVVSNVVSELESRPTPAPLITSTLQRLMSKQYNISSDQTMKAAQTLYEGGYISYHRTDSVRISDEAIKDVRDWLTQNSYAVPAKHNVFKNKDAAQDAHECIRPSDITLTPQTNFAMVDKNEKLVYEAIWRYFVASQMTPAIFDTLKITAHIKNDPKLEVKASGKALKEKGYLKILGNAEEGKIDLPSLQKGDNLHLYGDDPVKLDKKETQPPARYSEDKLIKELVNKSIGRPSTYASLLGTITNRLYVERRGNVYHATELGKTITDVLVKNFSFMDYNFSAKLEKLLDDIAIDKTTSLEALNNFFPGFKKELKKAYLDNGGELCEKCDFPMVHRNTSSGNNFTSCQNFPYCRNIKNDPILQPAA